MIDQITKGLDFQSQALVLRAERQKVLAANIANSDTPSYKATDFDFGAALRAATSGTSATSRGGSLARTDSRHVDPAAGQSGDTGTLQYRVPVQSAIDSNTVDMDLERMQFADNAVRYEATLRFINGHIRTMLSAIRGDQG
ncbi:MAG: flagellar basal body rod protein FlgB [Burkholderiales bacterium]